MSKITRPGEAGDVLASIRRLVADEASHHVAQPEDAEPPKRAATEPDDAVERDWLVGAVAAGEELRRNGKAETPQLAPRETPDPQPVASVPVTLEQDINDGPLPWAKPILTDGIAELPPSTHPRSPVRLLLTEDFRVSEGPGPGPVFARSSSRLQLKPTDATTARIYSEDSDSVDAVPAAVAALAIETVEAQPVWFRSGGTEVAVDDSVDEDTDLIDEETLRILVADIVRQELQGALGERITRNVRKLVRGEIARAFEAQRLAAAAEARSDDD